LIERNTFENNSENIYSKYQSSSDTYRYNLLLTPVGANARNFYVQNYNGPVVGMNIYQNIVIGGAGIGLDANQGPGNSVNIFNNTIYNPTHFDSGAIGGGTNLVWNIWNNIIYGTHSNKLFVYAWAKDDPAFMDYNDYFMSAGTPSWNGRRYESSPWNATTLSSWQSISGYDAHSLSSDPLFVNAGGTNAADYKRLGYPANGRGGTFASVMGAYITGHEQIGADILPPSPEQPRSPNGLRLPK
jgi:hypothetical protein